MRSRMSSQVRRGMSWVAALALGCGVVGMLLAAATGEVKPFGPVGTAFLATFAVLAVLVKKC